YFRSSNLRYDIIVRNKDEFLTALGRKDVGGKTIFIPDGTVLDLSGHKNIIIPENVTLLGDRGNSGKSGARILTETSGTYPLFRAQNRVKIIGLKVEGPDKEKFHKGIEFQGKNSTKLNMYK